MMRGDPDGPGSTRTARLGSASSRSQPTTRAPALPLRRSALGSELYSPLRACHVLRGASTSRWARSFAVSEPTRNGRPKRGRQPQKNLDVTIGALRVRCAGAFAADPDVQLQDGEVLEPGDL